MVIENFSFFELRHEDISKKSGIYKISTDNHIYIGSSKNLYSRLMEHRIDLINGKHSNQFLQRVCDKYGIENLRIDIIEFCEPEIRLQRE